MARKRPYQSFIRATLSCSLSQIEKAYGPNNAILDNCHVRVSFATNDERTAKRVSDALGTATEMRAMKNYAGHRLGPWFGHLMVSRSETARQLLAPGKIMQLRPDDEIVMLSGVPPIRAKKTRYYTDPALQGRVMAPPKPGPSDDSIMRDDDWTSLPKPELWFMDDEEPSGEEVDGDSEGAIRRNPELSDHDAIISKPEPKSEFAFDDSEPESEESIVQRRAVSLARAASLNPNDSIEL